MSSNVQMSFLHLSLMDPPVEASGGQEQYYIRSADMLRNAIEKAVDSQAYLPQVEASSGQKQYYVRLALHVPFAHLLFSYWRGKSYIPMS